MSRTLLLLAMLSSMYVCIYGQQDSLSLRYGNTITEGDLQGHLKVIASDEFAGRETGMPGQKKCEAYLMDFYTSKGEEVEITIQDYNLYQTVPAGVDLSVDESDYRFLEDFYYYPATKDGAYESDLVFSGYGIETEVYDDVEDERVKGKAMIVMSGEPKDKKGNYLLSEDGRSGWSKSFELKQKLAESKGATSLFIIYPDYEQRKKRIAPYFARTGMKLSYIQEEPGMPIFHISERAARTMGAAKAIKRLRKGKAKTQDLGRVQYRFDRRGEELSSSNVMAYIEGTDLKDELIVISAHYDHIGQRGEEISNGADDDGSGTVAAMEIAEAFIQAKSEGNGPRRSILVLHVSGEEKGLLGSRYYVDHPVWPLENTVADFNIDMIGRVDEAHEGEGEEYYVYLIGAGRISPDLEALCEETRERYSRLTYDYTYDAEDDPNQFYYRSDHYNFAERGIPSVFYFSGVHEDYHMPTDTEEKIMYPKLTEISRLIFHTVWELSRRDAGLSTP